MENYISKNINFFSYDNIHEIIVDIMVFVSVFFLFNEKIVTSIGLFSINIYWGIITFFSGIKISGIIFKEPLYLFSVLSDCFIFLYLLLIFTEIYNSKFKFKKSFLIFIIITLISMTIGIPIILLLGKIIILNIKIFFVMYFIRLIPLIILIIIFCGVIKTNSLENYRFGIDPIGIIFVPIVILFFPAIVWSLLIFLILLAFGGTFWVIFCQNKKWWENFIKSAFITNIKIFFKNLFNSKNKFTGKIFAFFEKLIFTLLVLMIIFVWNNFLLFAFINIIKNTNINFNAVFIILLIIISGMLPFRLILLFKPPIGISTFFSGLLSLSVYIYKVFEFIKTEI